MSDFRQLSDDFWASPQIALEDVAEAKAQGFTLIVNNRPEGEADDQVAGDLVEAAAEAAGMDYCSIPVSHAGFGEDQISAMVRALEGAKGPVLAYCRSGTRSTLLWALAQATRGNDPETLARQAASAGYDLSPIGGLLEMLAERAK